MRRLRLDNTVLEQLADDLRAHTWEDYEALFALVRQLTGGHPHGEAVIRWLTIRDEWGQYPCPHDAFNFMTAVDHSSLLRRLLEGKEPLPKPPPLAYSRPWYTIIETGVEEDIWQPLIWSLREKWGPKEDDEIIVFQGRWDLVSELEEGWRVSPKGWPELIYRIEPSTYQGTRLAPCKDEEGNVLLDENGKFVIDGPETYDIKGWRMELEGGK